ncbi:MAG: fibronectin type III domain-containing protein [Betaproteobacteria bacterium]
MGGVFAIILGVLSSWQVFGQAPSLVYRTQVYGRANADSLLGYGDPNLAKNAVAVDAAGNVYATGTTTNGANVDFLTVKYNAAGVIQWRAITNGGGNSDDIAYAVAVDSAGNVVVTGSSQNGAFTDYLTVKYDSSGVELWRAIMNGDGNADDAAHAIAIDSTGNVFVTGASVNFNGNYDYVTVKYAPDGSELWRMPQDGASNANDMAVAMCMDAGGNVAVTGSSQSNARFDYVTVKYRTDSLQMWRRVMDGVTQGPDAAFDIACDSGGNTYVTGKSSSGDNFEFVTVKYGSTATGPELWRATTTPAPFFTRNAFAIAADAAGNVIVTGSERNSSLASGPGNPVHLTIKYNTTGAFQWSNALNSSGTGADIFSALAVDAAGNTYTSGFDSGSNNLIVVKFAPGGGELWRTTLTGVNGNSGAVLTSLRLDGVGNIIGAGIRNNAGDNDFMVFKINSAGLLQWSASEGENTQVTTSFASGAEGRNALVFDTSGNSYVAGQSGISNTADFIVAKINATGAEQWRTVVNGVAANTDRAFAVGVDAAGNVYAGGDSLAASYTDFMTVKFNSAGIEQWRRQPGHAPNTSNTMRALVVDAAGNTIVTGAAAGKDFLTVKYDSAGTEQWRTTTGSAGNGVDSPVAMALDNAGNIVVTGRSFDGAVDSYLTVKFSPAGAELWRAVLDGTINAPQQPFAMAVDAAGNVFITGDTTVKYDAAGVMQWQVRDSFRAYGISLAGDGGATVAGANGLVVRYDATGNERWRRAIHGVLDVNDSIRAITVDIDGSVYIAGVNSSDPNADYLVVKYDADGGEQWRTTVGTGGAGMGGGVALKMDPARKLTLAGNATASGLPPSILITQMSQAPDAPTNVAAIAGNTSALVSFTPPAAGEIPIAAFSVACSPGAMVVTGTSSPIVVGGLSNGTNYSCTVSATNAFGTGLPSAAVPVQPSAGAALALFSVRSSKQHGAAGTFDIPIDFSTAISGPVSVEPRAVGPGHMLIFRFNNTVTAPTSVTVTDAASGSVGGAPTVAVSGFEITVTLPGIPDRQRALVSLNGVNTSTNASAAIGFLFGDVSGSRAVTASDLSALRARQGLAANPVTFRADIDLSGVVDGADLSLARTRAGIGLP